MTAPTPDAERVQGEATAAVERTEAAIYEAVWGGPRDEDRTPDAEGYQDARTVLAAALTDPDDPDFLARRLWFRYQLASGWITTPEAFSNAVSTIDRERWRKVADGLRAALLGGAS